MNPADLHSCGCSVRQLLDSKWWEGPPWLKLPPDDWPSWETLPDEDMVIQERRKTVVSSLLCKDCKVDLYYVFSNHYVKVVRVLAWVLRFVSCCKRRIGQCMGKILQYREILLAEKCIMRYAQSESFAGIQDKRITCMDPFLDKKGIIHLRTRIVESADVGDFAIPVMLPSHHPIVERMVLSAHVKSYHVGVQGLLSLL
jgi:hypothetical protein